MDLPFYREYDLPWTTGQGQERKFRRLLGIIFLICAVLGLLWPFIPLPEPDPYDVEEIPPRIAQLLLEEKPLPPPPPPPKEEEPEPEPEEVEPEKVVEAEPEPEPEPEPLPDREEVAREQAQAALMPFAEDLADLVDMDLVEQMADDRPLTASVGEAVRNERSMITSKAGAASRWNQHCQHESQYGRYWYCGTVNDQGHKPGCRNRQELAAALHARVRVVKPRGLAKKSNSCLTRTKVRSSLFTIVRCAWIRHSKASWYSS